MQVVFQRSICCPVVLIIHNIVACISGELFPIGHHNRCLRSPERRKSNRRCGGDRPGWELRCGPNFDDAPCARYRLNSRLLMACPAGPAEPAAREQVWQCTARSSIHFHQLRTHGSCAGITTAAQAWACATPRALVGASDGGKAGSVLTGIQYQSSAPRSSRTKKTTAPPGDHSYGACPV
jgi:hypothetical protein